MPIRNRTRKEAESDLCIAGDDGGVYAFRVTMGLGG